MWVYLMHRHLSTESIKILFLNIPVELIPSYLFQNNSPAGNVRNILTLLSLRASSKYKSDFEKSLNSSEFQASFVEVLAGPATFVCDFRLITPTQSAARSLFTLPSFSHFRQRRNLRFFPTYLLHLRIHIHLSYPKRCEDGETLFRI